MKEIENKIIDIIDNLRPFLINDGGNIEFVKYPEFDSFKLKIFTKH